MKKIISLIILACALTTSCSINKQEKQFYPIWWEQPVENEVSSFGKAIHAEEKTARFAAQNNAFRKLPGNIAVYLNQYVAMNCIEPGDEVIQKELDKVFTYFIKYFQNIADPQINQGETEFIRRKYNGNNSLEYFARLFVKEEHVHSEFVKFLETSDLYMNPRLREVLRECFEK